jgi:hypothetical protein
MTHTPEFFVFDCHSAIRACYWAEGQGYEDVSIIWPAEFWPGDPAPPVLAVPKPPAPKKVAHAPLPREERRRVLEAAGALGSSTPRFAMAESAP